MNREQRQALALAGVFQAATVVDQLARTGQYDSRAWETLIRATLETNPESFEAIYGFELDNLGVGIDTMKQLFDRSPASSEVMRYALSLLLLANKLHKDEAMLDRVGARLSRVQGQAQHFGPTHENVIASLGELYQDTLSTYRYRIVVNGDPSLLSSPMMPERVRAVLLAGIRFALLWRQQGGRRWQLVLMRGRIKRALAELRR
ncbi:high frequency lysogenization protein HflD [Halotalea alkalilenta]|uniref:High frequency lysogenization protein HflD homolog n=1 Tax=Halotalea alkalilenta TaxID=376489 RepID=A0A172YHE4_9GAMM|nr:high frequency lysogenization protein HflD [Halotalea alkalilenta]ANF58681.1 lysogenization protein HflD [Halotalea alkalilenta]